MRHNARVTLPRFFRRRRHVSRDSCHGLAVQRCSLRAARTSVRGVRIRARLFGSRGQSRQRSRRLDRAVRATESRHSDSTKRDGPRRRERRGTGRGSPVAAQPRISSRVPLGGPRGPCGVTVSVRQRTRESRAVAFPRGSVDPRRIVTRARARAPPDPGFGEGNGRDE